MYCHHLARVTSWSDIGLDYNPALFPNVNVSTKLLFLVVIVLIIILILSVQSLILVCVCVAAVILDHKIVEGWPTLHTPASQYFLFVGVVGICVFSLIGQ